MRARFWFLIFAALIAAEAYTEIATVVRLDCHDSMCVSFANTPGHSAHCTQYESLFFHHQTHHTWDM